MERRAEEALESIRRKMLFFVLPLLSLGFAVGAATLHEQPLPNSIATASQAAAGIITTLLLILLAARVISTRLSALITAGSLTAILLVREWTFFETVASGAAIDTLMLPIYGFMPLAFLIASASLHARDSLIFNSLSCLLVAAIPVYNLLIVPVSTPLPAGALPLLMLVGMGFPGCVFLFWLHSMATVQVATLYRTTALDARTAHREASKRQRDLEALFQYASTGIGTIDDNGTWLEVNERLCDITAYSTRELMRLDLRSILQTTDGTQLDALFERVRSGEIDSFEFEQNLQRKDGHKVWAHLSFGRIANDRGDAQRYVVVVTDISEQRKAKDELENFNIDLEKRINTRTRSLQKLNSALTGLAEFVGVLQSAQSEQDLGNVVHHVLPDLLHTAAGSLIVTDPNHPDRVTTLVTWGGICGYEGSLHDCWALRRGRRHSNWKTGGNLSCRHVGHSGEEGLHVCQPLIANAELIGVLTLVEPQATNTRAEHFESRYLAILATVSDYIAAALLNLRLTERLRESATRDFLTGLRNRRSLREQCLPLLSSSKRSERPVALAMVDVDHFKRFNDNYGHALGDQVLKEVALVLQRQARASDLVFRLGGEEFLIVMPDTDLDGALVAADKIRQAVKQVALIHKGDRVSRPTVSMGLAAAPEHGHDLDQLLGLSDKALYRAKENGRDRCEISEAALDPPVSIQR